MIIKQARFIKSSTKLDQCPEPNQPEFAFIGRSNVGKSSLINMLVGRKNLAKTSAKPGKTQHINHFLINDQWYLVDLPGYGWSKVSKAQKAAWGEMIEQYLLERRNLDCLFVLIDGRLSPQPIDYEFLEWLGVKSIPFVMVYTKTDKLSKNKFQGIRAQHSKALQKAWEELPASFVTSAEKNIGRDDILHFIHDVIQQKKA